MISRNVKKRIYTSAALFVLLYLIIIYKLALVYSLVILSVLSIIEFLNLTKKVFKNKFNFFLINSLFFIYTLIFCSIFFFLTVTIESKIILFIILIGCIASDIGGFIFGKLFKGPKLTHISPNKTYSGAIGSLFLTVITMSFLFFYITNFLSIEILIVSFMTSIFCQFGDLLFSYLKRKAKQKDTGNIFPGHGGVLDRLDGIFLGLPSGLIIMLLIS
ncbi:MAG: phosphatidate cytidylyltransferase [Pelagibacteraceae bacterium]|nr:phosphatidate cytidylyltransferase [Pelagibacteraceae bacterium]